MPTTLVDHILQQPHALLIIERAQTALAAERRRQRFYVEVREDQKAEFVNGEMIVHSPVKKRHAAVSGNLYTLLRVHCGRRRLGFVGHEKLLIQLTRNDYEPDVRFFKLDQAALFTDDQSVFPPPDFVVKVRSPGTQARDRGIKFEDDQAHGIEEYWIVNPTEPTVEQYALGDERYARRETFRRGDTVFSGVGAGFAIPVQALTGGAVFAEPPALLSTR